jgi:hypothetical protein
MNIILGHKSYAKNKCVKERERKTIPLSRCLSRKLKFLPFIAKEIKKRKST